MQGSETREEKLRKLIRQIRSARSKPKKLKALLENYECEFGNQANQRVLDIIAENTKKAWSEIAEERGSNSIGDIIGTLWQSFENAGGEFSVDMSEHSAQIHCTKCPIADTYFKIGKAEYGLIFHCSTDPHIVAGFNPDMEFKISKRLMSGDDCCNHYYHLD